MSLISVAAEGTHFDYLPAGSDLSTAAGATFLMGPVPNDLLPLLANGADTRLAQFRCLLPPYEPITYILLWTDHTDLDRIDSEVKEGRIDEQNFYMCFRTSYSRTYCFSCHEHFNTLVIDAADPYPGNSNLRVVKINRAPQLSCPNCQGSLRRLVVKIL